MFGNACIKSLCFVCCREQCDTEEVDRLSGKLKVAARGKYFQKYVANKPPISAASHSENTTNTSGGTSTSAKKADEKSAAQPQAPAAQQSSVPLPKQSGFVPRQRNFSVDQDKNEEYHPPVITVNKAKPNKQEAKQEEDIPAPVQSSFIQRRLNKEKQKEAENKLKKSEAEQTGVKQPPALSRHISLQDSIDKVRALIFTN